MLLVFLVAMVPLGWLVRHLHGEAMRVDGLRLYELAHATYKSLLSERSKHQVMLQTWVTRLKKSASGAGAHQLFDELGKRELGRFRAVGYAEWKADHKLEVRFVKTSDSAEDVPIGTDLAVFPAVRKILALEPKGLTATPASNDPSFLQGIGERVIAVMSVPFTSTERGVIFATILPEDFLVPARTSIFKINADGTRGAETVLEENLPGVGEGIMRIDSVSHRAWDAAHHEQPQPTTIRLAGTLLGDLNLVFRPGPNFARDSLVGESWLVLGIGSVVAVLFALLAWLLARQGDALRTQVLSQTAELRTINDELSRFKSVAETTSDFVGICDMEQKLFYLNAAGRAMIGYPMEAPISNIFVRDIFQKHSMDLINTEGIPHALSAGPYSNELIFMHRDGSEVPVSFVGFVIRGADGKPMYLGGMARDITKRREIDQQLRQSLDDQRELVRMKSQFVNTVSHEFRTPLGVILASADILTHYLDRLTPSARMDHLGDIHRSSIQMAQMLDQVLDLGRIEAGRFTCSSLPLDLPALLQKITDESLSASSGCRVELHLSDGLAEAKGDESLLRHIFLNILSNARKYSPPDSCVEFSVHRDAADAVFMVKDHGIGIPKTALPHLFEAFSRAQNVGDVPGTGLGLAIVKRCADLHHGVLDVESEEGRGTLFTIRLPLFATQSPQ